MKRAAEALLIVLSGADALAAFAPIHCPGKAGPVRLECLGLSSDTSYTHIRLPIRAPRDRASATQVLAFSLLVSRTVLQHVARGRSDGPGLRGALMQSLASATTLALLG